MVRGKLSAMNDGEATQLLSVAGYQMISLKPFVPFVSLDAFMNGLFEPKPAEVILFFRQLAMLLEAGTNIATSLEMLQQQARNRTLRSVLGQVIADVRSGTQLSVAMIKHPKIFPSVYCQLLGVGEQSGNLETILNQVADYMEKELATAKATKSALMMPALTAVIAVIVVGLLIVFVLPSFADMYASLGATMPGLALWLIHMGEVVKQNFIAFFGVIIAVVGAVYFYIRTDRGRYVWDRILLSIPRLGNVRLLSELARYCRSMSLLFRAGMPLSEVMPILIKGSNNKVLANALTDVQREMFKGEGLSRPMSRNKLFLPMMVQMIKVGEETGNLEITLLAVARSFEAEAEDKIKSMIALLPPAMTIIIGSVVGLIAVTLLSAMTSMYGQAF